MLAGDRVSYLDVLRLPRVLRAFMPSLLGKMSFAMVSLALLLFVQADTGSFALSGTISGLFGLANVAVAPLRARLVDRYGVHLVLPCLGLGYALGLAGVVFALDSAMPKPIIMTLGALAGLCTPPLGAVMRGVWSRLSPSDAYRSRAYSLDAVAEELIFIAGPLLVGVLAVLSYGPAIAVLASAGAGLLGSLGLGIAPVPKPQRQRQPVRERRGWIGPLRHARFWPVLVTLCAVGTVMGASELLATAHATLLNDAGLSGMLLTCLAVGSAISGLFYGARSWKSATTPRMLFLAAGAALTLLVSAWAGEGAPTFILFAVMGTFIAPSMITGYLAADDSAPHHEQTEASALVNTAVNAGAALALASGGALLDSASVTATVIVLAGIAGLCILASLIMWVGHTRTGGRRDLMGVTDEGAFSTKDHESTAQEGAHDKRR